MSDIYYSLYGLAGLPLCLCWFFFFEFEENFSFSPSDSIIVNKVPTVAVA